MKIAARHNIDARVAAKAASERVIQMILSPSIADLTAAANWDRVDERKHVGLAFLRHKL